MSNKPKPTPQDQETKTERLLSLFDPDLYVSSEDENFVFYAEYISGDNYDEMIEGVENPPDLKEVHCIDIKFDQIFEQDISQYNIFRIPIRKYYSLIPMITNDLNYIFNRDTDLARIYVKTSMNINLARKGLKEYTEDMFIDQFYDIINTVKGTISDYIEETYDVNLDNKNKDKKKNTNLQITDDINKKFLKASMVSRVILPVVCQYYTLGRRNSPLIELFIRSILINYGVTNDDEDFKKEDVINCTATPLLNKLIAIIDSRISQTSYIHKMMWNALLNTCTDQVLTKQKLYFYLIEAIIAKFKVNSNFVNLVDVVLNKQLTYLFTANFSFEFKPLRNLNNEDDSDERDRINEYNFTANRDEAEAMLNKLTIAQIINNYESENGEIDISIFENNLNNIQNYFVALYYEKVFRYKMTKENDRKKLLVIMVRQLMDQGFDQLVNMILCDLDTSITQIHMRTSNKIKNNRQYTKILENYLPVADIVDRDNFIVKAMSFKNLKFVDEDNEPLDIRGDVFDMEVLNFFDMIIHQPI